MFSEKKNINLPLLQFDRELDLLHCFECCRDAFQQRRDFPFFINENDVVFVPNVKLSS